jgi:hypothetical protein
VHHLQPISSKGGIAQSGALSAKKPNNHALFDGGTDLSIKSTTTVFELLECRMPLPVLPDRPPSQLFLTKSFQNTNLGQYEYIITEDGQLLRFIVGVGAKLCNNLFPEFPTEERLPYCGDIQFYTSFLFSPWWGYTAHFEDGRCTHIWCNRYRVDGITYVCHDTDPTR